MASLRGGQTVPLSSGRYAMAISHDRSASPVDVDLQAVVVNDRGSIVNAVYYNNLKALGCVTHSGDEQTGDKSGYDEMVWVSLSKLPQNVQIIIFVIAAHHGGHLKDVTNGMIHVLEERKDNEVAKFAMERSVEEVDMVAAFVRAGSSWLLQVIDEPAQDGQHFMDILEPSIGNFVRKLIPGAPRRMKVAFAMDKGAVMDLPRSNNLGTIKACLGWDVTGDGVDLDVSAVFFDSRGQCADAVFFGQTELNGLVHSGDNLTGAGEGDDEVITCNLQNVPSQIQQIFIVVNIYTRGITFERVRSAYCRVVDSSGSEMARYKLNEGARQNGLIIARFIREDPTRFGFQAVGSFAAGQTWKDSTPEMAKIAQVSSRQMQSASAPPPSYTNAPPPAQGLSAPPPQPAAPPGCCAGCTLM